MKSNVKLLFITKATPPLSNLLILLRTCRTEFVKFPKIAVFKKQRLCARFTLRTLKGRLILRQHLKTTKAVFTIPNSYKCLKIKEKAGFLQPAVCIGFLLRKFRNRIAQQLRFGHLFTNFADFCCGSSAQ